MGPTTYLPFYSKNEIELSLCDESKWNIIFIIQRREYNIQVEQIYQFNNSFFFLGGLFFISSVWIIACHPPVEMMPWMKGND